jgi:hypothetical protein
MGTIEDLAQESSEKQRSTGKIGSLRKSAEESRRRHAGEGDLIWAEARKARKGTFPLKLDKMTNTKGVLMNDGHPILAHRVIIGWFAEKGYSFPKRELVRCAALKLGPEYEWLSTGKPCPFCTFLGKEPRLVILWGLIDLRQSKDPKTGEVRKVTVARLEADSDKLRGNIWDGVTVNAKIHKHEETTTGAMYMISRSADEKSFGGGDSWTFMQWVDPKMLEPYLVKMPDWDAGWPLFSDEALMTLIETHKKICDDHKVDERDGYSQDGYARLVGAPIGGTKAGEAKKPAEAPKAPGSLEELSSGTAEPNLDDLADKEPTKEGDAPDFDPWGDKAL